MLTNPKARVLLLVIVALNLIISISEVTKEGNVLVSIMLFCFMFLILFLIMFPIVSLLFPSEIKVIDGQIMYSQIQFIHRPYGNGFAVVRTQVGHIRFRGSFVKVNYTVTNIDTFEAYQTKIEKVFNTGHIIVYGKTRFDTKKHLDCISDRQTHMVYGIKNFKKYKSEIEPVAKDLICRKHRFDEI